LSTSLTPAVRFAMPSIAVLSLLLCTGPRSVTVVPTVMIFTFLPLNETVLSLHQVRAG